MRTEYTAQIRKLRLPEQDELKNESELCSADPVMLKSIDRALGQQVRIKRSDGSGFVALFIEERIEELKTTQKAFFRRERCARLQEK